MVVVALFYAPFLSGLSDPGQLLSGMSPSLNPMPNNAGAITRQVIGALLIVAGLEPAQYTTIALNGLFVILLMYLVVGLASTRATLADVWGRFGLATLIYTYLIYGGSFPWYLVCPLTALALGPPTHAMLYVRLLTIGLGFGFMAQMASLVAK
jgi:hypothetical protein